MSSSVSRPDGTPTNSATGRDNSDASALAAGPGLRRAGNARGNQSSASHWNSFAAITPAEVRRRVWHIAPGMLPIVLWLVPHRDPVSPTLLAIVGVVVAALSVKYFTQFGRIQRPQEKSGGCAILGYAGAVFGMLLLFPAHAEWSLSVLGVLAFGDGTATLGGLVIDGKPLPWNKRKTWSGTLTFVLIGTPMTALIYWGETAFNPEADGPGVPFLTALGCSFAVVLVAALAESLPSRINDNIRVGLTAGVTLVLIHLLWLGGVQFGW